MDVDLSSDFKEKNLENLVNFYEDGLRRVSQMGREPPRFSVIRSGESFVQLGFCGMGIYSGTLL